MTDSIVRARDCVRGIEWHWDTERGADQIVMGDNHWLAILIHTLFCRIFAEFLGHHDYRATQSETLWPGQRLVHVLNALTSESGKLLSDISEMASDVLTK